MGDAADSLIIGIDGGGTRCRFGLSVAGKLSEGVGPAANASTDLHATIATLAAGLADLAAQTGLTLADLAPARAYVGLAGVLGADQADPIKAALPMQAICVDDDRRAAVVGALGDGDGIVAGIGTGSFLARKVQRDISFVGGWGLDLGDEASGAWLGRTILTRVLMVNDGFAPASPLTESLHEDFGKQATQIVAFAREATPQAYAQYAPRIADAADEGDANAAQIMAAGAAYISHACSALGWTNDTPICLIGGLAPRYARYLPAGMAADLVAPKGRALDGALALAARIDAP